MLIKKQLILVSYSDALSGCNLVTKGMYTWLKRECIPGNVYLVKKGMYTWECIPG
jgi:hypothetical protein